MLIVDIYEGDKKVAELPAREIIAMSPEDFRSFWRIQAMLGRHEKYVVIPDPEDRRKA
ncbi:MAG: hypothetical protein ABIE47_02060 [Pseudomonadota bacterium]